MNIIQLPPPPAPKNASSPATPTRDSGTSPSCLLELDLLLAAHRRLIVESGRLRELVATWRDMPADEMRLRAGEMTAQEIRNIRAVLNSILPNV
jgi:hypothetical protein